MMRFTVPALLAMFGVMTGAVAQDSPAAGPVAVLQRWAPSLVTVRATIQARVVHPGGSQQMEQTVEISGVVVDASGLVMLSGSAFHSPEPDDDSGFRVELVPQEFKVVLDEDDEQGQPAFLAATYDKLGLAFVKVRDVGDRKLSVVDFGQGDDASLGQDVIGLGRLGKGYDYAPYFDRTTLAGRLRKPRKAWLFEDVPTQVGLPVFSAEGQPLGAVVTIDSTDETEGGRFGRARSGRSFMVPAPVVAALVKQAQQQAAELEAKGVPEAGATPASTEPTEDAGDEGSHDDAAGDTAGGAEKKGDGGASR